MLFPCLHNFWLSLKPKVQAHLYSRLVELCRSRQLLPTIDVWIVALCKGRLQLRELFLRRLKRESDVRKRVDVTFDNTMRAKLDSIMAFQLDLESFVNLRNELMALRRQIEWFKAVREREEQRRS